MVSSYLIEEDGSFSKWDLGYLVEYYTLYRLILMTSKSIKNGGQIYKFYP